MINGISLAQYQDSIALRNTFNGIFYREEDVPVGWAFMTEDEKKSTRKNPFDFPSEAEKLSFYNFTLTKKTSIDDIMHRAGQVLKMERNKNNWNVRIVIG